MGFAHSVTKRFLYDAPRSMPTVPGWGLTFAAAFMPLAAGLTVILATWVSSMRPDAPYGIGTGTLDFSRAGLADVGPDLSMWIEANGSVGGVNIVAAAVGAMVISLFGLRLGQKWAWWFLLFCFVWVGLVDAAMAIRFWFQTGEPLLILPYIYCFLMAAGLIRSRPAVFRRYRSAPGSEATDWQGP